MPTGFPHHLRTGTLEEVMGGDFHPKGVQTLGWTASHSGWRGASARETLNGCAWAASPNADGEVYVAISGLLGDGGATMTATDAKQLATAILLSVQEISGG